VLAPKGIGLNGYPLKGNERAAGTDGYRAGSNSNRAGHSMRGRLAQRRSTETGLSRSDGMFRDGFNLGLRIWWRAGRLLSRR
jgi:hypothetical protein